MRSPVVRVAAAIVVAAGVYTVGVVTAGVWTKGPQADGDPVGFNFATPAPSSANKPMTVNRTVPAHRPCVGANAPCDVRIQYFTTATPCPANVQCTLPPCPNGAECITFGGTTGVSHTDHGQEDSPHEQENLDIKGIVILQSPQRSPPPH